MNGKKIFKNYIYNLIYEIMIIVLPIVTTPYLSRVLGAEKIGIYGYTLSIVTYFTLIGALGIAKYGKREIAYVQEDIKKRSKIFWELNIIKICTISIAAIIFYFLFCIRGEYAIYYRVLILELIATVLDISWFFQGIEHFGKVVIRNATIKFISVILIFVLVKSPDDLIKYFCIYVVSNFLGNGVLWFNIRNYIQKVKINIRDIKEHFKPMISLFIPQIAVSIYTILDKSMLGLFCENIEEVGYYEQSQKIIKIALTLITTMSIVMLPRISNVYAHGKQKELNKYMNMSFKFDWFLGVPIMFGIIATAANMVPWFYGPGYSEIINLLMIGSPIIIFIALSTTIGTQYLVSIKKQNIQTLAVSIGAGINVILNLILIPILASTGAIIATVIAELMITLIQVYYISSKNIIKLEIIFKGTYKYLISGILMCVFVKIISGFMPIGFVYTLAQVIIGAVLYILVLLILQDDFLTNILKNFRKRKGVNI